MSPQARLGPPRSSVARDLPPLPGVTLVDGGADIAVYAGHAEGAEVCFFEAGDSAGVTERRVSLPERAHGWWFGFVPDVRPGQRYNLRVDGAWDPEGGVRHNAAKLLLDPYARALEGEVTWGPEVYGHVVDPTWHDEPLGLQLSRLLRAARRLRRRHGPPGGGRRVQGHGQAPPSGGDRGHPRRRLQPHSRAEPHRRHPVVARPGPAGVLPAPRAGTGHRRHRVWQH